MKRLLGCLVGVAGAVTLALAVAFVWVWMTIPPAPDPDALPSRLLAPPAVAYRAAVEEGGSIARSLVAEEKLPGLSLAVAVDGEIVWAEGLGWADMENRTAVTPATRFRVGGVSEALTAAAVGLLAERGELDLDAPVQRYVPSFPRQQWPITTRQLMAHTGGVRPYRGEGGIFQGTSCADDAERLAIFSADPLAARPGTERRYSTYGWSLVGAVIAGAAGEPYLDFVRREVLAPVGMASTAPDIAGRSDPESARFYYPRLALDPFYGLQDAPVVDLSCHLPAVGFLSTPVDLVRFGAAMMEGSLLDRATVAQLQAPVRLAAGEPTGQALGWTVRSAPLGPQEAPTRIVGQGLGEPVLRRPLSATNAGGQVAGGTTTLAIVPDHGLAIAVASNVSGAANVPLLASRLGEVFRRRRQPR